MESSSFDMERFIRSSEQVSLDPIFSTTYLKPDSTTSKGNECVLQCVIEDTYMQDLYLIVVQNFRI